MRRHYKLGENGLEEYTTVINDGVCEMPVMLAYVITNKYEYSCFGDQKGVVFMGSSNFTYNGLLGQGEMNERFSDNVKYVEYEEKFESLWSDSKSIDICVKDGNKDFERWLAGIRVFARNNTESKK